MLVLYTSGAAGTAVLQLHMVVLAYCSCHEKHRSPSVASVALQDEDSNSNQQLLAVDSRNEQHITATSTAVVGLSNLGNTCFFNSSVQLLLACAPLQQMLLQQDHHIAKGPLGYALQQAAIFANGEWAETTRPASYGAMTVYICRGFNS
jgi:hypothetical protein